MAYSYYRPFTTDHTQAGASDLTDFPVAVIGTFAWLATVANGGDLQNGNDRDWFSNNTLSADLDWENVAYNAITGYVEDFVRMPTYHHAADDTIYMGHGDAAVTAFQGNVTATWNSTYDAVYHFGASGGSLVLTDSTSNGRTLTNNGGVTLGTGKVGVSGATTASGKYLSRATDFNYTTQDFSFSFWMLGGDYSGGPFPLYRGAFASQGYLIRAFDNGPGVGGLLYNQNRSGDTDQLSFGNVSTLTWYHIAVTRSGGSTRIFLNGALTDSTTGGHNIVSSSTDLQLGGNAVGRDFPGFIDELRFATVQWSDAQVLTEYNNQNAPGTFIAPGSRVSLGSSPALNQGAYY